MRDFEWDDQKAAKNLEMHRVSFETAIAVFADPRLVLVDTTREQDGEPRAKAIGLIQDRLFAIVFTLRGATVRLISARRANRSEERAYGYDPPSA